MDRLFPASVYYLFKCHCVWFDKEINIKHISTGPKNRENTNKYLVNRLLSTSDLLMSNFSKTAHYTCAFFAFCPESSFKRRTMELGL